MGFRRSLWALGNLAFVLVVILFVCAGAAKGLVAPGLDDEECVGDASHSGECIDKKELFGSIPRAMLTLMQLVTGDGWAKVVRSLSASRPLASIFLTGFVVVCSYGLLSVVIGVLVKSTIKLARTHSMHGSQKGITEDRHTIEKLKGELERSLEKPSLRLRDVEDCMHMQSVKEGMDSLDLPFADLDEMFHHLDLNKKGELSIEEFTDGLMHIRKPSNANDNTALTARIGGSVTYVKRMGFRADGLRDKLHDLRHVLGASFEELGRLAEPNAGSMAEVALRRTGVISNSISPSPPRYTS
mmetsp:Transcript_103766/g.298101  ORF Transcript_103766/g.298101 Transcript_103766/m.298101 type:complete len:299 (-) Transcript_103766:93-989(-)